MDTGILVEYAQKIESAKWHEEKAKRLRAECSEIEQELIDQMTEAGIPSLKVKVGEDIDGNPEFRTLYTSRTIWASLLAKDETTFNMLRDAGYGAIITEGVHSNRLSAIVRELDPEANLSPEELKRLLPSGLGDVIKVTEKWQLKSRVS